MENQAPTDCLEFPCAYGVAGKVYRGTFRVRWRTAQMPGRWRGVVTRVDGDGETEVDQFDTACISALTPDAQLYFAVFVTGLIHPETVSHLLSGTYRHCFFLTPEQAARISELRPSPDLPHRPVPIAPVTQSIPS